MRKQATFNPRAYFRLHCNRHMADNALRHVCKISGLKQKDVFHVIEEAGLACLCHEDKKTHSIEHAKWLFVYDPVSLQAFLDQRQTILQNAGWPSKASAFVQHVANVTAPAYTPLFDLIHEAYGNDCATSKNPLLQKNLGKAPTLSPNFPKAPQS